MAAARKRSSGMSPGEWAVVIGGFSLLLVGVLLAVIVASRLRSPGTDVAQAPAVTTPAPSVAPSSPPVYTPPQRPEETAANPPQPSEPPTMELVAQRLERRPEHESRATGDIKHQWWYIPTVSAILFFAGIYTMVVSVMDCDFVFVHGYKAPRLVRLVGRELARVYYFCLGACTAIAGAIGGIAYLKVTFE